MQSKASTVQEYLDELPEDRRETIEVIRQTILDNLPTGYEEGMLYGMIGYYVPLSVYPDGYHCNPKTPLPFANLASQKNHMAFYGTCIYTSAELESWFRAAWKATGKKLDMGKSCVRFKKLDDVALEVLGECVRRVPVEDYIRHYEANVRK